MAIAVSGPRLLQQVEVRQQETGNEADADAEPFLHVPHADGLEGNSNV